MLSAAAEGTMMLPVNNSQSFLNGEIHSWYRTVLGFPDHLVGTYLDRWKIKPGQVVLDPFCGSGTALVECKKRRISSFGIDANPSSSFASRVKTNWKLRASRIEQLLDQVGPIYRKERRSNIRLGSDRTFLYLQESGMVDRGWITETHLRDCIALKRAVSILKTGPKYSNLLFLALLDTIVRDASNVKFGPELYCGPEKKNVDVFSSFSTRIEKMFSHIGLMEKQQRETPCVVISGDSRKIGSALSRYPAVAFDCVITSPPYPTEHDYSRNARLELAFLECVYDRASLQKIKRTMMRSHTKGIYADDRDSECLGDIPQLRSILRQLEPECAKRSYGFARLYPKVLLEYFGGMKQHLRSLRPRMRHGARLAYVVGDQSSYFRVHIPTADILAEVARSAGYRILGIDEWRLRRSTSTSKRIRERILLLQRP